MQKEGESGFGPRFADHAGREHQVVVVDPDQFTGLAFAEDRLGETPIDQFVALKILSVVARGKAQGMEKGPEGPVREAVEVVLDFGGVEFDRRDPVRLVAFGPPFSG